jgi:hypothetical protein
MMARYPRPSPWERVWLVLLLAALAAWLAYALDW